MRRQLELDLAEARHYLREEQRPHEHPSAATPPRTASRVRADRDRRDQRLLAAKPDQSRLPLREANDDATSLASDAVVAAFDGGIVFLWDDKIGYAISASTGDPLGALVRSDDYRGIFMIGGSRHLQLDAEVTAIGLGGTIFSYHAFHLAGIVDGCAFDLPAS